MRRALALCALLAGCMAEGSSPETRGSRGVGADLDSGPVVRLIYLVPADREESPAYIRTIERTARHLQRFYYDQMHGATFRLHDPIVEVHRTEHAADWYATHSNGGARYGWWNGNALVDGFALTGGRHDDPDNVWIYYVDSDQQCDQMGGAGTSGVAALPAGNDIRAVTGVPLAPLCATDVPSWSACRSIGGLGHELGHALGLPHPPGCDAGAASCDSNALMYLGYTTYPATHLRPDDKVILATSRFMALRDAPSDFDCTTLLDDELIEWASPSEDDPEDVPEPDVILSPSFCDAAAWTARFDGSLTTTSAGYDGTSPRAQSSLLRMTWRPPSPGVWRLTARGPAGESVPPGVSLVRPPCDSHGEVPVEGWAVNVTYESPELRTTVAEYVVSSAATYRMYVSFSAPAGSRVEVTATRVADPPPVRTPLCDDWGWTGSFSHALTVTSRAYVGDASPDVRSTVQVRFLPATAGRWKITAVGPRGSRASPSVALIRPPCDELGDVPPEAWAEVESYEVEGLTTAAVYDLPTREAHRLWISVSAPPGSPVLLYADPI